MSPMRVMTMFGTRPEIIRLSCVIRKLDQFCEHILVHTGQNYDPNLSDIFFRDLGIRSPDIHLGVQGAGFAEQAARILEGASRVFQERRPNRLLILGDTNSGLSAIVAARMRIPVFHMEAGNRCFDDRVPEEINRRIIDHSSDVLMPYTHRSKDNLVREGIERERIYVTGNPIFEVMQTYLPQTDASTVLKTHGLERQRYFLVTLHRSENVDEPERLAAFLTGLDRVVATFDMPMLVSVHPRTADKMQRFGLKPESDRVILIKPLGFFDFVRLERDAFCVLSDSGTVQEECCIMRVPNVTLRDVTERAETIECGSNILAGADAEQIERAVRIATSGKCDWTVPPEYMEPHASDAVVKIVLGYDHSLRDRP